MGSQTQPKVPVIDLSKENLKPGTNSWLSTGNDVWRALEEWGCFVAVYDRVPSELHNSIFTAVDELFNLPTDTRLKNTSNKPYHGYFGQYSSIPLYESLAIDNPTTIEETQSFTKLMWPAGNDQFCESAHSFSKIVAELIQMVMRMVFESYGVEEYYDSHIGSTTYLLRFFRYRAPQQNETNMGLNSHTDKTIISIIHQSHVNGLQIKAKNGEWIDIEPSPSSFLILAGDALMAWSNDRIPSANHRVIMSGNQTRYSLGLFSFNCGEIHVPEELVDDEHPLRYKAFNHFGFLSFNLTAEGLKSECPIKAYCGV